MIESNFIQQVNRYFNYGYVNKPGKILSWIHPAIAMKFDAGKISECFKKLENNSSFVNNLDIHLPYYKTNNENLSKIFAHLQQFLKSEIKHAIVHGSLATGEEINYSDFDGLIIIKD